MSSQQINRPASCESTSSALQALRSSLRIDRFQLKLHQNDRQITQNLIRHDVTECQCRNIAIIPSFHEAIASTRMVEWRRTALRMRGQSQTAQVGLDTETASISPLLIANALASSLAMGRGKMCSPSPMLLS